jgi:hypothetical protein
MMLFLILSLVVNANSQPEPFSAPSLYSEWKYVGFIYDGRNYPAPNPKLYLSFTFFPTKEVRLYWKREDEDAFCERLADYEITNGSLKQTIVWVNPQNHFSCGSDPDMQMGKQTVNKIEWDELQMRLFLELSGKPFIYLLNRQ